MVVGSVWHKLTPPWKGTVLDWRLRPEAQSTLTTLRGIKAFLGEEM